MIGWDVRHAEALRRQGRLPLEQSEGVPDVLDVVDGVKVVERVGRTRADALDQTDVLDAWNLTSDSFQALEGRVSQELELAEGLAVQL